MKRTKILDTDKLFSLEAEAGVLGSIIIDKLAINKVIPKLPRAESFFRSEHRTIYEALIKLYVDNKPIDAISLRTELKERGKLEEIGGVEYITRILQSVPSSANAAYYAEVVRAKEKERQVRTAIEEMAGIADGGGTVNDMVLKVQSIAMGLELAQGGSDFVELKKEVTKVAGDMRENKAGEVATGFSDLDWMVHGYYSGEYVILAGRPSMGKSALALAMALNMSRAGTPVFFSSLEMSSKAMIERALCSVAKVDMTKLRSGEATKSEWELIYETGFKLRDLEVVFSTVAYTPEQFAGLVHRLRQTHKIGIAFVDYVQLMNMRARRESRQQEMSAISQALKRTAMRENIPVVVLSQLNREVDSREKHRPRMSDLRESGSLEQDADLIQFVYRDDYYMENDPGYEPTGITEIITAKNRRGRTGTTKLLFIKNYAEFRNLTKEW